MLLEIDPTDNGSAVANTDAVTSNNTNLVLGADNALVTP